MADDLETLLKASPLSQAQRADLWDAYQAAPDADALGKALEPLGVPKTVKAGLWDLKSKTSASAPASEPEPPGAAPAAPARTWMDTAKDVGAGFVKGATRTVQMIADDLPHVFGGAGLSDYADAALGRPSGESYQRVSEGAQSTNTPQRVGGALESAAELALPLKAGADAVPTAAKAGAKFQAVMGAAKNMPVNVNAPGQVALRIQELAEHGGSMPMAVRKFINYVTDPNKPAMTYEVARDFASNISRLSVDEFNRLTPVVKRELGNLRVTLNKANADAASAAGKGKEYAEAMNEFARAKRFTDVMDSVIQGAKKAAPYGLGAGVAGGLGYAAGKKLYDLWSGL